MGLKGEYDIKIVDGEVVLKSDQDGIERGTER